MPTTKTTNVSTSGTAAYRAWALRLARHRRSTLAATIDLALADLAERVRFAPPPPRCPSHETEV